MRARLPRPPHQDKALGCDLHAMYTEHPIEDSTDEERVAIAGEAFDQLMAGLLEE